MKIILSSLLFRTPIGTLQIQGNNTHIFKLGFIEEGTEIDSTNSPSDTMRLCARQLNEYFTGIRTKFQLPLKPLGTPFQVKVWDQLIRVPYGKTAAYSDIAEAIKNPKAVRAVGGANHNNPISIIIPCHRIIGKDGSLTGYGGGLWRKKWLLDHEKKISEKQDPLNQEG